MYYESAHGWPVTFKEVLVWGDYDERTFFEGVQAPRHDLWRVNKSKTVDPADYPKWQDFYNNFIEAWQYKTFYILNDNLYDKYLVHPDPYYCLDTTLTRIPTSGQWYGAILHLGREFVVDTYLRLKVPYADLKTAQDLIGFGDFTYGDLTDFYNCNMHEFFVHKVASLYYWRVQLFEPRVSHKFQGKISLYMSKKEKDRDRLTALRPGRAFKLMFPELKEKDIDLLVDAFNRSFPVVNLTLLTGSEEKDFIKAYSYEQSEMQNVYTTSSRKSLANSCMKFRPEHEGLPKHPSAAYASGDFLSIWTEDEKGRIASRCVLYLNPKGIPQAGPVYGTTEQSIDIIEEYLRGVGASLYEQATWVGAKLLYIECGRGVLAPYIDHEKALERDGNYLVITGDDEYRSNFYADTYAGVLRGSTCCEECEEAVDSDDVLTTEDGRCLCPDCYSDHYAPCYESGDEYPREDLCPVRVAAYRWGYQEEYVHNPEDYDYQLVGDYWYASHLVVVTEQGDTHLVNSDDWFTCAMSGEDHNIEEMVQALVGGTLINVSKTWVEDNDYVISDLVYVPKEEEQEEAA